LYNRVGSIVNPSHLIPIYYAMLESRIVSKENIENNHDWFSCFESNRLWSDPNRLWPQFIFTIQFFFASYCRFPQFTS